MRFHPVPSHKATLTITEGKTVHHHRWSATTASILTVSTLLLSALPAVATESKPMTTAAVDDLMIAPVLKDMNWRREDVTVSADEPSTALSAPRCRFFTVRHRTIPGAGMVRFVLDAEGNLRARTGDMEGLAYLLRTCLPPEADATVWAELIADFSSSRPARIIAPDNKLAQANLPAGRYKPPLKQVVGQQTQLEFFASGYDSRDYLVKAVLPASGPVRIDMQALN